MTISELICRLQAEKCEHGDLHVKMKSYRLIFEPTNVAAETGQDGNKNVYIS